jgi:hypothetical protein
VALIFSISNTARRVMRAKVILFDNMLQESVGPSRLDFAVFVRRC